MNFIKMILNNGEYKGKRFLSPATVDLLFVPQVRKQNGISLDYDQRGLGWIVKGDYCSAGDLASPETILSNTLVRVFSKPLSSSCFCSCSTSLFLLKNEPKPIISILSNRVHPSRSNIKIIPWRGRTGNYIISKFGRE